MAVAVLLVSPLVSAFVVVGSESTFSVNFTSDDTLYDADREEVAQRAVRFWADRLSSSVPIEVNIAFIDDDAMPCEADRAVLGNGGATSIVANFANAPFRNTVYPVALASALAGFDVVPPASGIDASDISINLNARLDDNAYAACLGGGDWYYGNAEPLGNDISLYSTILHELAHGLGFQLYADLGSGELIELPPFQGASPIPMNDIFLRYLYDLNSSAHLSKAEMTNGERVNAATSMNKLVWDGAAVSQAASLLSSGVAQGKVMMFAPSTFEPAATAAHFSPALSPDELMEPANTPSFIPDLTVALMDDIGWSDQGGGQSTASDSVITGDGGGFLFGLLLMLPLLARRPRTSI
ncbi:MAG: hypothetical protein P1U67_01820 [Alcanivoracaceae bacterium]|nr:hypothetical protein [Alcanivoracaceae bacterium]